MEQIIANLLVADNAVIQKVGVQFFKNVTWKTIYYYFGNFRYC